jgi:polar amino acid transport system substrate-binding protein
MWPELVRRLPLRPRAAVRLALTALGLGLIVLAEPAQAGPAVLRVGVVDGSQPCSYRQGGVWKGLAVNLWDEVAQLESLPFIYRPMPSIRAMLEATRRQEIDVAVECINITPTRLKQYRFSLPFQEDGQAVLIRSNPLSLSQAFLKALVSPSLFRLLGALLLSLLLMSLLVWVFEDHAGKARRSGSSLRHRFVKVFTILLTGEGDAEIVDTSRGRGVLMAGYLVRNVSSALLVGFLTVELVENAQGLAAPSITRLSDLVTLRVGLKAGTVSEDLLEEVNRMEAPDQVRPVPLNAMAEALPMLETDRLDAVLGDGLQMQFLQKHSQSRAVSLQLAIKDIRPEMQAFGVSKALPEATLERINLAITRLQRNGTVQRLRQEALASPLIGPGGAGS